MGYGGGGWDATSAPAAAGGTPSNYGGSGWASSLGTAPAPSGGGSNWFGSWTDPLGIVSATKNLAVGIAKGFGTPIYDLAQSVPEFLSGNGHQGAESLAGAAQGVGDFGAGMLTAGESLSATAALPFGGPNGLTGVIEGASQGFNKWLGQESLKGGQGLWNAMSPEMGNQLYNQGKGMRPADWLTQARSEGIGGASIQTAAQAAMVLAPVEGVPAILRDNAEGAAAAAVDAGALADAARYTEKAARWDKLAQAAEPLAHPVQGSTKALGSGVEAIPGDLSSKIGQAIIKAGHPFQSVGMATADLLSAARAQAFPADVLHPTSEGYDPFSPASNVTPETMAAAQTATVDPALLAAVRDNLHPTVAAADAMAQSNEMGYTPSQDLQAALAEATRAAETKPSQTATPTEPTVTLYRGEQPGGATNVGEAADVGSWYTDHPEAAKVFAGENGTVSQVEVPQSVAEQSKVGNVQFNDAGDLAGQYQVPETYRAEPAPGVEPQVEPRKYDVAKGKIMSPEEKQLADAEVRQATAEARQHVDPPLYVFDQLGQRLSMPPPQWATWIADHLPDSVNRLLGKTGANIVTQIRYQNLYQNAMQAMQTAQRVARTSPAMTAAEDAARLLLSDQVGRDVAEARIGEELHARINGEALVSEWTKAHDGFAPSNVQIDALRAAARGGYQGLTDEMLAPLTPEAKGALEQHLEEAINAYRSEASKAMETLMASRYGAKGLEAALLSPDEVPMSPEQLRMYRRSERDLRFAEKARERIPKEQERLDANAAKAAATGSSRYGFVDSLRAKLGLTLQTADDLYKGLPKGLENDGNSLIQNTLAAVAQDGGALMDVSTGLATRPTVGINLPLASQFDIPLEQWASQGAAVLHDALFNPKDNTGGVYDPQRLYGGADARLAVNIVPGADGAMRVVGTLTQNTINGEPIAPWQAHILGAAHQAVAGYDFATGENLHLPLDPNEQNLMKWYAADVLDSKSELSRWATQRADVAAQLHIPPEALNAEMSSMLWLDRTMAAKPTNLWKQGDIFKTDLSVGKGEPSLNYLAQTIMENVTLPEHVDKAMAAADAAGVNKMLAWYYDSHNFIESAYRGKTIPFTGRDAAETFYDVLALSSVMASPTQNLGRALAGFANLDDFLQAHTDALTNTQKVMDEVMGNKPAQVVYVKNLGVKPEDLPRNLGESTKDYNRRVARDTEKIVPQGQGGTPVSQRFIDSPAARDLSHQTSMTTGPKYRIIDALLGRLNLETATAEDIGGQPEWWNGKTQSLSDVKVTPQAVLHHAELLGVTGSELDAYRQWAVTHERISAANEVRQAAGKEYVNPITDTQDFQRQRAESEGDIMGGRKVSAQEYQNLANDGRAYVEQRLANSSPHVLDTPELRQIAYKNVQEEWGGATVDAHTGQPIPADYNGDTFAVTARLNGVKETAIPIGSSEVAFNRAYDRALRLYADVLNSEGGHLGIFRNEDTKSIEIDPVYHTTTAHDTEAVGSYAHSNGGAYHFASGNGYWIPHVPDDEAWTSMSQAKRDLAGSVAQGRELSRTGDMRNAYENALMEYHGSGALAKLRSFRDNLAHPHESLAVTLDSIMAQLFGFDKTHWGVKGEYAKYADQIRQSADQWSQVAGRQVMPHETQALLWVYAKRAIGEQDWGRLQAHAGNAHTVLNLLEDAVNNGKQINVQNFDPFGPWWNEELQFSRDQLSVRTERKTLRTMRTAGTLSPDEAVRLDQLEKVPTRQETSVEIMGKDGVVEYQPRHETSYDAKVLSHKEMQRLDYLRTVAVPVRQAIEAGDFNKARSIIDEFTAGRRKSILGSVEGGEFGPKMVQDPTGVAAQSIARLQNAKYIPAPNAEALNTTELFSKFGDRTRGVTLEHPNKLGRIMQRLYSTADVSTLLHEDLHAFRLHAPGDEVAEFSKVYPHIQDATLTPGRVAAEEQFVSDFMGYLRARSAGGTYTGANAAMFNTVADTMEQHYGPALNTESGHAVASEVVNYWDSIFNKDIQAPAKIADPLSTQYTEANKGVNPTQNRGESDAAFVQRTRQYGEARGRADVLQQRVRDAEARAFQAQKFANTMAGLAIEPTRSEIIAQKLESRAQHTLGKLADQLEAATGNQIPRGWRPYMDAVDRLREEASKDPALAPLLDEIPQNFQKALQHAAAQGFDPTYIPDLTYDQAQKYLFGHLQLGSSATEALTRRENQSVLASRGVTDRSLQALGAGTVIAMKELLQSRIIQFTEEHYARQWTPGQPIPEGWRPWAPARDAIITGHNIDNKIVAVNADMIVPEQVVRTLAKMQRPPVDLPFRFIWKGAPVQVWKHLLLTFSPTWYIKHFIGAVSLATMEGARLGDWRTAFDQWRNDTLPDVVKGRNLYQTVDSELGITKQINARIRDINQVMQAEGVKSAAHEVVQSLRSVVKTTDELGRAAVYARTIRSGGSASLAAYRAAEALGDFGRLGPLERSMVTQIIPFYSFQKAMFRVLTHLPVDHPVATGMLMQLGTMHEAYMKDQLGGSLPDNFLGSNIINGQLVKLDKLNPLADAYRLFTLDGIAQSANPFVGLLAQQALHSPTYYSTAGMDANGNLVQSPDLGQSIMNFYTGAIPGIGKPLGPDMLNVTSTLSDAQYQKLLARILKTQRAEQTVADGGYLVTDAYKPANAAGGWSAKYGGG